MASAPNASLQLMCKLLMAVDAHLDAGSGGPELSDAEKILGKCLNDCYLTQLATVDATINDHNYIHSS